MAMQVLQAANGGQAAAGTPTASAHKLTVVLPPKPPVVLPAKPQPKARANRAISRTSGSLQQAAAPSSGNGTDLSSRGTSRPSSAVPHTARSMSDSSTDISRAAQFSTDLYDISCIAPVARAGIQSTDLRTSKLMVGEGSNAGSSKYVVPARRKAYTKAGSKNSPAYLPVQTLAPIRTTDSARQPSESAGNGHVLISDSSCISTTYAMTASLSNLGSTTSSDHAAASPAADAGKMSLHTGVSVPDFASFYAWQAAQHAQTTSPRN